MTGAWGDDGRDDLPEAEERGAPAKRFFYTDPLAAAWMAKHFGMWFEGLDDYRDNLADAYQLTQLLHEIAQWKADKEPFSERIFVHADSLHLIEPQVGDCVEFDRWFFERRRDPEYAEYPYQSHYGKVTPFGRSDQRLGITSAGVCWDNTSDDAEFSLPFKIIQRAGIAFMWPESVPTNEGVYPLEVCIDTSTPRLIAILDASNANINSSRSMHAIGLYRLGHRSGEATPMAN